MAMAHNENALTLAKNFQPDIDELLESGVACFGVRGAGKSNVLALMVEQMSRFLLPMVVFDTKGEYGTLLPILPHGYLADVDAVPTPRAILEQGLQVVVNLQSCDGDTELASSLMADLVNGLLDYAAFSGSAIPCPIFLDEAQKWLPESRKASEVTKAFSRLGAEGRSYGLTPFLFTQRISEIKKSVISQCGVSILMRQTLSNDIKRYGEYVELTAERKDKIASFAKGQAIVHGLSDGSRPVVKFYEQKTEHVAHTPKARAAVARFAGTSIDFDQLQTVAYGEKKEKPAKPEPKAFYTLVEALVLLEISRAQFYILLAVLNIKPAHQVGRTNYFAAQDIERIQEHMNAKVSI